MSKKSVIIEGPNGAGKSTLARRLSEKFRLPLIHPGPAPQNESQVFRDCLNQSKWLDMGCILDRCTPVSQLIYSTETTIDEMSLLNKWLEVHLSQAVMVYCHRSEGLLEPKEYYPEGHFDRIVMDRPGINDMYQKFMNRFPVIHYDWKIDGIDDIAETIRGRINNGDV